MSFMDNLFHENNHNFGIVFTELFLFKTTSVSPQSKTRDYLSRGLLLLKFPFNTSLATGQNVLCLSCSLSSDITKIK